ncbi:MAG: hypothetical protein EOP81_17990 [Variovorax sp.]|nr:MAG: hypothetical protein EOP81_17990 [Variovorax sp.]
MTSFVHVDQPTVHPGVERASVLIDQIQAARRNPQSARPLVLLLIAAMVAAGLVAADKLVSNWDEGRLLAAWTVLCAAAFAVLALYANVLRAGVQRGSALWQGFAQRRAAASSDARFLATAQNDPRIMQELQIAMTRQRDAVVAAEPTVQAAPAPVATARATRTPTLYEAMRRMNSSRYY